MPESDGRKDLDGLARSIDALFSEGADENDADAPAGGSPQNPVPSPPRAEALLPDPVPSGDAAVRSGTQHGSAAPLTTDPATAVPPPADDGAADGDVIWAGESDEAGQLAATRADPAALAAAVDLFLSGAPREHEGLAREVVATASALSEGNDVDPIVDAVERLTLAAGEAEDDQALGVARSILTPQVAGRLALRLSVERDEQRTADVRTVCRRLGDDMVVAFREGLADATDRRTRRASYDALIAMGEVARGVIEAMVDDDNRFLARNAVSILGEIGGERAIDLVTSALAHTDARVRREALLVLAKLGAQEAGPLIIGMLDDPDADVRVAAVMAAGELKLERALKPLLARLETKGDPDLQLAVLRALGQIGDPGAVNAIEKHAVGSFFSKPPTEVRIAAYRALHHIGTPRAKKLLGQAAGDKDPEVQAEVRELVGAR